MSYTFITSAHNNGAASGGLVTPAVNMTGAGILVALITSVVNVSGATLTDTGGNTWIYAGEFANTTPVFYGALFYAAPVSVSSSYQLTVTNSGNIQVELVGFSGVPPVSPLEFLATGVSTSLGGNATTPAHTPTAGSLIVSFGSSYATSGSTTASSISYTGQTYSATTAWGGISNSYPSLSTFYVVNGAAASSTFTASGNASEGSGSIMAAFTYGYSTLTLSLTDTISISDPSFTATPTLGPNPSLLEVISSTHFVLPVGSTSATSSAINTVGASAILVVASSVLTATAQPEYFTDNQGNLYTNSSYAYNEFTLPNIAYAYNYYSIGTAATGNSNLATSTSHSFTISCPSGDHGCNFVVYAIKGNVNAANPVSTLLNSGTSGGSATTTVALTVPAPSTTGSLISIQLATSTTATQGNPTGSSVGFEYENLLNGTGTQGATGSYAGLQSLIYTENTGSPTTVSTTLNWSSSFYAYIATSVNYYAPVAHTLSFSETFSNLVSGADSMTPVKNPWTYINSGLNTGGTVTLSTIGGTMMIVAIGTNSSVSPLSASNITDTAGNTWQSVGYEANAVNGLLQVFSTKGNFLASASDTVNITGTSAVTIQAFVFKATGNSFTPTQTNGSSTSSGASIAATLGVTPANNGTLAMFFSMAGASTPGPVLGISGTNGGSYTGASNGGGATYNELGVFRSIQTAPNNDSVTLTATLSANIRNWMAVEIPTPIYSNNYTLTLTDAFTLNEIFSRTASLHKTLVDTLTIGENFYKSHNQTLNESSPFPLSDSITKRDAPTAYAEDFTQTSTETAFKFQHATYAEPQISLTDSDTKSLSRSVADARGVTDSVAKNYALVFTEVYSLTDTETGLASKNAKFTETFTLVETFAHVANKVFSETKLITDSYSRNINRSLYDDAAPILDYFAEYISHNYSLADALTLADALGGNASAKVFAAAFSLVESLSGRTEAVPFSETITITEIFNEVKYVDLPLADVVDIYESYTQIAVHGLRFSDVVTPVEIFHTAHTLGRSFSEVFTLTETIKLPINHPLSVIDVFTIADLAFNSRHSLSLQDRVSLAEFFSLGGSLHHYVGFFEVFSIFSTSNLIKPILLSLTDIITLGSSIIRFYNPYLPEGIPGLAYGNLRFYTGYNAAPTAVIDPGSLSAALGQTYTFDASHSFDPNLDPVTFSWSISPPPTVSAPIVLTPNGSSATVYNPIIYGNINAQVYTLTVSVSDNIPGHMPSQAHATITYPFIDSPTVTGATIQGARNAAVLITSITTVSPYASLSYSWTQTAGTTVALTTPPNVANLGIYTAGALIGGETLQFTLTVSDGLNPPVSGVYNVVIPSR